MIASSRAEPAPFAMAPMRREGELQRLAQRLMLVETSPRRMERGPLVTLLVFPRDASQKLVARARDVRSVPLEAHEVQRGRCRAFDRQSLRFSRRRPLPLESPSKDERGGSDDGLIRTALFALVATESSSGSRYRRASRFGPPLPTSSSSARSAPTASPTPMRSSAA